MKFNKICESCSILFYAQDPRTLTCSPKCKMRREDKIDGRFAHNRQLPNGTIGALSELEVCLDLTKKGYSVFRAISQSCFCDLIATKLDKTVRIEARTGFPSRKGTGKISFPKTIHGHSHIDMFAVYIPAFDKVKYYTTNLEEIVLEELSDEYQHS